MSSWLRNTLNKMKKAKVEVEDNPIPYRPYASSKREDNAELERLEKIIDDIIAQRNLSETRYDIYGNKIKPNIGDNVCENNYGDGATVYQLKSETK